MAMAYGNGLWQWPMAMVNGQWRWQWSMAMADGDGGWSWRMAMAMVMADGGRSQLPFPPFSPCRLWPASPRPTGEQKPAKPALAPFGPAPLGPRRLWPLGLLEPEPAKAGNPPLFPPKPVPAPVLFFPRRLCIASPWLEEPRRLLNNELRPTASGK